MHKELFEELRELSIDCLVVTDFRGRDPFARALLGLKGEGSCSRRWFAFLHSNGTVTSVTHRIEPNALANLSGGMGLVRREYSSREELISVLREILGGTKTVAACYSPEGELPYLSTVDAGTVELLRLCGPTVVSAAELLQRSCYRLDGASLQSHLDAGRLVHQVKDEAFQFIHERLTTGAVSEFEVVSFIEKRFEESGLVTNHSPVVATNRNSSLPHYSALPVGSSLIHRGDFVLIDLWAKLSQEGAIYHDITWVGVFGRRATPREKEIFTIVSAARDAAVALVQNHSLGTLSGAEVDRVCRKVIVDSGYEKYFVHRTGHSISTSVHGEAVNLDSFETVDTRKLIPWSCFSIEPGIYLPEFGIRSEVNMFLSDREALLTGPAQQEILEFGV